MDSLINLYGLRDEDCNEEISNHHLREISSSLCEDWRSLPSYLELEEIVVRDIDRKPVDENEKRHTFLTKWKSEKGSGATYKKLMASLLAIKCRDDAEKVCKLVQKLVEVHVKQVDSESNGEHPKYEVNAEGENSQSHSTSVNYSNGLDPSSDIYKDLKLQLEINLENILYQYASYVTSIRSTLQKKEISVKELHSHLLNLPVFLRENDKNNLKLLSGKAAKLGEASSIIDIFDILSLECCSFLDFGIFKSIVKQYNVDEGQDVFKYPDYVDHYLKLHKIEEFMIINPALRKLTVLTEDSEKLVLKFDICMTTEMGRVMDLKAAVAKLLGLRSSALLLLDIQEGCVVITFLISETVAKFVFSRCNLFSSNFIQKLHELSVTWLQYQETFISAENYSSADNIQVQAEKVEQNEVQTVSQENSVSNHGVADLHAVHIAIEHSDAGPYFSPTVDQDLKIEPLSTASTQRKDSTSSAASSASVYLTPPESPSPVLSKKPSLQQEPIPGSSTCSEDNLTPPDTPQTSRKSGAVTKSGLIKKILEKYLVEFVKKTDLEALYSHFYAADLINRQDFEELRATTASQNRNMFFYIILLDKKGPDAYKRLFECLKNEHEHLGHEELVKIIEDGLRDYMSPVTTHSETQNN